MSEARDKKHLQTPYQRWEMATLHEVRPNATANPASMSRLAQEMVDARDAGQREGYQAGLLQGRSTGHAEGLAQGLADSQSLLHEQQAALLSLCQNFSQQATQAREQTAQQLLALAMDMAQAVLKSALVLQPDRLLPVVDHAIQSLPSLQLPAILFLHPQDLPLVQAAQGEALAAQGWRLRADGQMTRGGCRIETPSNAMDATLETRWHRLQQAFGLSSAELSPL
jgi:flagellar assembly protein FliH